MDKSLEKTHIFQNHPAIIVKGGIKYLLLFVVFFKNDLNQLIRNGFSLKDLDLDFKGVLFVGLVFLALGLLSALNGYIKYKKSYIELREDILIYKKNTLFKHYSKESNLSQVSNIHFSKSILDKVFACTTMELDINSSATANESDYSIFLSLKEAEKFKNLYNRYRKNKGNGREKLGEYLDLEESLEKNEESFTHVDCYSHFDSFRYVFLDTGVGTVFFLGGTLLVTFMEIFEHFSLIAMILFLVTSFWDLFKKLSKYYNYTVKSNDTHIMWSHGLFTEETFTIEKKKISSIEIKQEFFARLFGQYAVRVNVVGIGNSEDEMRNITLYNSEERTLKILKEVFPSNEIPREFKREDIKVGTSKTILWSTLLLSLCFVEIVRTHYYFFFPVLFLIAGSIFFSSRGKGLSYQENKITIVRTLFSREIKQIEIKKIEHISIRRNVFYDKWNLAMIRFYYKDNEGFASVDSGYIDKTLVEKLIPIFKNDGINSCL